MNKQDILNQIEWHLEETEGENASGTFDQGYKEGCYHCEALIEQLDEPQKVKVPAFVAEYIEAHRKWGPEIFIGDWLADNDAVYKWLYNNSEKENNRRFLIAVKAFVEGYEVEESKWIVKRADGDYVTSFNQSLLNVNIDVTSSLDCASYYKFTDRKKAEAVATLVNGSVDEV